MPNGPPAAQAPADASMAMPNNQHRPNRNAGMSCSHMAGARLSSSPEATRPGFQLAYQRRAFRSRTGKGAERQARYAVRHCHSCEFLMSLPGWTILCDFDGTISVEDVIDSLLDRFGRPGWEVLEQDWRAGRIGSRECMSGQVDLLHMTRAELDSHLAA